MLLLHKEKPDSPMEEEQTESAVEEKQTENAVRPELTFLSVALNIILVAVPLLIGIVILIFGTKAGNAEMIFFGIFWLFGAFTFVLVNPKVHGYLKRAKIDILQIYGGTVTAVIGIGWTLLKYREMHSFEKMAEEFGLWLILPVLIIITGVFQVLKGLIK